VWNISVSFGINAELKELSAGIFLIFFALKNAPFITGK